MSANDQAGRISSLLAEMTLDEKIGQLNMVTADWAVTGPKLSENYLASVRSGEAGSLLNLWGAEEARAMQRTAVEETRLGIPLILGFDTVHGQRTIFPVPLGEASAFSPEIWRATARAAADEATADGLNLTFAPMIDVCRDPRWGRIVEGPGEDPTLAQRLGVAKIEGFQGDDLADGRSIAATAKHLGAYGAVLAGRDYASVEVSDRLLHEVYYPPFVTAIEAGTAAIMPSFNDLAGVPVTANGALLDGLARERWGFDGLMISDYNAITELLNHGVAGDKVEAAALALKAGTDIDMMGDAYLHGLKPALERGLVTIEDIDRAVERVLEFKARLGLFDDPYSRGAPLSDERKREIRALAREAARRSVVLLTNRSETLPLAPTLKKLALLGPLADSAADMIGPWSGAGVAEGAVSFLTGLRAALPETEIVSAPGVTYEGDDTTGIEAAIALARDADVILLCLGESAKMSGEASSRARPEIPPVQRALAEAALALGTPVVAVLTSGRPLMATWLMERADAVLAAWYLGSEAGPALADILTGAANPSGRLPVSWPVDVGQVPIYFGRRPTGRPADPEQHYTSKYLDMPTEPLFPFGHGLSYTRFAWRNFTVTPERFGPETVLEATVEIANEGKRVGTETVLLFSRDKVARFARPLLELKDFQQVTLAPGESATVRFALPAETLAYPGDGPDFAPVLEPGEFEISVGPTAAHNALQTQKVTLE